MDDDDFDFDPDSLSSETVRKLEYLFGIEKSTILREHSKWMTLSRDEKDEYDSDFAWYLSSKYQVLD